MAITAAQVKELREMTGAGMMDCKKALTATEGDMDKAVEFLREKGLATAQKKANRVAAEGLCKTLVADDAKNAVVVEVNSETDFVAKDVYKRQPQFLFNISCNYTLDIWSYDGVNKKYRIIFTHKIYIIIIKPFSFHGNAY